MKLESKQIYIEKETVFRLLECSRDNPLYEEMETTYETLLKNIKKYCQPKGVLDFSSALELGLTKEYGEAAAFAMVLYCIGEEISERISSFFDRDEYFNGMVLDAMADSCLFSMEKEWNYVLVEECKKRNLGIERRMEAPTDFSIETQKRSWQLLEGEKIGVTMTSAGMFHPVKTICLLFLLTEDICQNNVSHACNRCTNMECRLRK